jgi:hypothetical protein
VGSLLSPVAPEVSLADRPALEAVDAEYGKAEALALHYQSRSDRLKLAHLPRAYLRCPASTASAVSASLRRYSPPWRYPTRRQRTRTCRASAARAAARCLAAARQQQGEPRASAAVPQSGKPLRAQPHPADGTRRTRERDSLYKVRRFGFGNAAAPFIAQEIRVWDGPSLGGSHQHSAASALSPDVCRCRGTQEKVMAIEPSDRL